MGLNQMKDSNKIAGNTIEEEEGFRPGDMTKA